MTTATIPMIRSHELIDVARWLVSPALDGAEPSQEQIRRAVSTAYYALFHELVSHATAELCGDDPPNVAARRTAARWFGHSDVRLLAEAATGAAGGGAASAVASVLGTPHQDLKAMADLFVALQDDRYRADYDHESAFDPLMAFDRIVKATLAINWARQRWDARDPSYLRFLRLMVGAVKIAKARR